MIGPYGKITVSPKKWGALIVVEYSESRNRSRIRTLKKAVWDNIEDLDGGYLYSDYIPMMICQNVTEAKAFRKYMLWPLVKKMRANPDYRMY